MLSWNLAARESTLAADLIALQRPDSELVPTDDWQASGHSCREHFFRVLAPRFAPADWVIISVRNLAALADESAD